MGLLGTLGKVAMGVMIAKGVGNAMGGSGGLSGMLGGLLGGDKQNRGNSNQQSGGLAGGLGGLLNSLSGGGSQDTKASTTNDSNGGLGGLLNSAFAGEEVVGTKEQEEQAKLLLKSMISAAKADGSIDADEQKKITEHIGDITPEDIEFVKNEMQAPVDIEALIASVPSGMEQQVYMMSLLAINLDSKPEALYLDKLAKGLNIPNEVADGIHEKLGVTKLYS
jgi:uncharacterized membrane protein YebE (DUF533 family)